MTEDKGFTLKYIAVVVLVSAAVSLGITLIRKPSVTTLPPVPPSEDRTYPEKLGAASGQTWLASSYFNYNGVERWIGQQAILATSSILCDFPNPWISSTTPIRHVVRIDTNTMGAEQTMDISTSTATTTSAYASSSPALVRAHSTAGMTGRQIVWPPLGITATTSATTGVYRNFSITGESDLVLASTTHITTRIATASPVTVTSNIITGSCTAEFEKL